MGTEKGGACRMSKESWAVTYAEWIVASQRRVLPLSCDGGKAKFIVTESGDVTISLPQPLFASDTDTPATSARLATDMKLSTHEDEVLVCIPKHTFQSMEKVDPKSIELSSTAGQLRVTFASTWSAAAALQRISTDQSSAMKPT